MLRSDYWAVSAQEWDACKQRDDATNRRRLAGLRSWHRRSGLTLDQVYESGARIVAIERWGRSKGLDWRTRASWERDMPGWCIPGLSRYCRLVESSKPTGFFWLVWPVILDGHVLEASALQSTFGGRDTWWVWRGAGGQSKTYLGMAHSLAGARRMGSEGDRGQAARDSG